MTSKVAVRSATPLSNKIKEHVRMAASDNSVAILKSSVLYLIFYLKSGLIAEGGTIQLQCASFCTPFHNSSK